MDYPAETTYSQNLYEELEETGVGRPCISCGGRTSRMSSGFSPEEEYSNALIVSIFGGYGMFCDPQDSSGFLPGWTVVLCHDCTHEACERLPWLEKLLTPAKAHSHTEEYRVENPDHFGWDYEMAAGTYYTNLAKELFPEATCKVCSHAENAHERKDGYGVWTCETCGPRPHLENCYPEDE